MVNSSRSKNLTDTVKPIKKLLRDDVYVQFVAAGPSMTIIKPGWDPFWNGEPIPDMPVRGKVLLVSPDQLDVKVGDVIQFYFGAVEAYYPDRKCGIVNGRQIHGVIED